MESEIDTVTICEIFIQLKSIGCCLNCCLHVSGIKTNENLDNLKRDSTVQTLLKHIEPFDENAGCICCMGLLQSDTVETAINQVIDAVISSKYDATIFNCNLTAPVSLMIREKSIHIAIAEKFEKLTENQLLTLLKNSSVKDIWKLIVLPKVAGKISKQYIPACTTSCLTIDVVYQYKSDEDECTKILNTHNFGDGQSKDNKKKQKFCLSRNKIEKILINITNEDFKKCFPVPPPKPTMCPDIEKINCYHGSIFIGGRYTKLSRHLSQTPWFINGEKKMETSVQDLLGDIIVNYTKTDTIKFLSSGREDVDVRTINSGRPFAIELVNPRITSNLGDKLKEMITEINASTNLIKITSDIKILSGLDLKRLKEGETQKTKFYRALCLVKSKITETFDLQKLSNMSNIEIIQKTPLRVLHRRALAPRDRIIHAMRARWLTENEKKKINERYSDKNFDKLLLDKLFVIDVKTQAGTYVKEFVHGDFGRTVPSLCDILDADIDIIALDVTGINIHWP